MLPKRAPTRLTIAHYGSLRPDRSVLKSQQNREISSLPSYRDRFRGRVPNLARDTRVADHVPKCAKT